MKTVTYETIKNLAADLAGRPRGKLPTSEATMLRTFFAAELPDLWDKEAWPELCDHLEAVTLDAEYCFDLREGDEDEMGDILAILVGGDPRVTTTVERLPKDQYIRLDDRVNVMALSATGGIWVDWQTPCPDLLDDDFIIASIDDDDDDEGEDVETALPLFELPARFKLPLAMRGAALLLSEEDPAKAATLRSAADIELAKQTQRISKPWWRA